MMMRAAFFLVGVGTFALVAACGDVSAPVASVVSSATTSSGAGGAGGAGGAVEPTSGSGGASAECVIASDCGAITECVSYACIADACQVTFTPKGTVCGNANADTLCDGSGTCVLKYCFDGKLSGSETDVDCGGPFCKPCVDGRSCNDSRDCTNGVCETEATSRENSGKVCKPCTLNDHCAEGRWCNQGACVLVEEAGVTCSSAPECATGHCADGVCCNTACDGACDACSKASGAEQDGTCRIKGVKNAADPGRCDDTHGTCGGACSCDAKGACILAQGETCTKDVDCATGHCADGVCCNTACDAACSACSKKKSPDVLEDGTCTAFAIKNADDAGRCDQTHGDCGGACSCNAEGACDSGLGETCTLDKDCVSGHCADGVCCNTECTGNCNTCVKSLGASQNGTCTALVSAQLAGSCDAKQGCGGGACACNATSVCALKNPIQSIGAGSDHTCAILKDGALKCWGRNHVGQLGLGNTTNRGDKPGQMGDTLPAVNLGQGTNSIGLGGNYSCAVVEDGSVRCWGNNEAGELGLGTTTNALAPSEAVPLGLAQKTLGNGGLGSYACVQFPVDGRLACWGYGGFGQLGIGSTTNRGDKPNQLGEQLQHVNLGVGVKATSVSTGNFHTCAVLDGGSVRCWGYNYDGQLGTGNNTTLNTPGAAVAFAVGEKAVALSLGRFHSCALLDGGKVKCWGDNSRGQLGTGNNTARNTPGAAVAFAGGENAVALVSGAYHVCALLNGGKIKCWGDNVRGQLGLGSNVNPQLAPTTAVDLGLAHKAVSITSGYNHVCALLEEGSLKCWGDNGEGRLGLGDTTSRGTSASHMGDNLPYVKLTGL